MNVCFRSIPLKLTVCAATLALSASALNAQTLLSAAAGTTVYESSQNGATRPATGLFDGTPTFGSAANLGGIFDASDNTANTPPGGTDNDYEPIVAFSLGSLYTVTAAGYANNTFNPDSYTGTINIFALSAAQYSTYTATLMPSQTTGRAGGLVAAPTSYMSEEALTVTDTADGTFTQYALGTPLTGEYYALQFVNSVAGYTGTGAFLGGQEFRFIGSPAAVPEPTSLSLLALGLGAGVFYARRRLAGSAR